MSQLLTMFKQAVDEFNACQKEADYLALKRFYFKDATLYEVDPPNKPHGYLDPSNPPGVDGNEAIVEYMAGSQPKLQPKFWPDYSQIVERPANSNDATDATLDGWATYLDNSRTAPLAPIVVQFHFEFTRAATGNNWLVKLGEAS